MMLTVKLTKSSSINPQDTGLQPVANPPCWASKTAVSLNLTIPKDGPEAWQDSWSAGTATYAGGSGPPDPFRMLVRWIRQGAELGRTSDARSFDRYFEEKRAEQRNSLFAIPRVPPTR